MSDNPAKHEVLSKQNLRSIQDISVDPIKTSKQVRSTSKNHGTSTSTEYEPAIWSRDTSQRIPCFDRC